MFGFGPWGWGPHWGGFGFGPFWGGIGFRPWFGFGFRRWGRFWW